MAFSHRRQEERILDLLDLALEDARALVGPEHALGLKPGVCQGAVADQRQLASVAPFQCQFRAPFLQM